MDEGDCIVSPSHSLGMDGVDFYARENLISLFGHRFFPGRCSWYSTDGGGKNEENPVLEVGEQNLKHWLASRFRAQWKQAFGWKRSSAQCSYDPYSYSLNFDDGLSIP
ncbi:hypothetical protein POPTR_002G257600v4 [Populus trichocarpa]|uniref:Uncharacterized protein n=1 Tax=Populus trichocarpa TaxID=3694 RepID=A0ACC0TFY0_POPTR|nr:hypothetical protein BDE02_02G231300 [Populus trichocarpa]KAI9400512.1 hypothetical protein POPTR_002G257600v4 [Populus trichocarpa]